MERSPQLERCLTRRPPPWVGLAIVSMLATCAANTPATAVPLLSTPSTPYPTGAGTAGVAIGDMDGDGRLDLVTANRDAGTITILLGQPDGAFTPLADQPSAAGCSVVRLSDLDRDGVLDVVTGSVGSNTLTVMLGDGNGGFSSTVLSTGLNPWTFFVEDVTGDGTPDLVGTTSGAVAVLPGRGDGTFGPRSDYPTPFIHAEQAGIGDLNGDGHLDVMVSWSEGLSLMLGNGDGSFAPGYHHAYDPDDENRHHGIALGDANGDGRLDLARASTYCFRGCDTYIRISFGNGDGTFGGGVVAAGGGENVYLRSMAFDDLNGDGRADLVSTWSSGMYEVTFSRGDGSFGQTSGGSVSGPLAFGDLDRDGRADMVAVTGGDAVSVFRGNGDGTFGRHSSVPVGFGPVSAASADLDGDGLLDVVAVRGGCADQPSETVGVLRADGTGGFTAAGSYYAGYEPRGIALGNLDSNQRPDIAVAVESAVTVLLDDGSGGFRPAPASIGFGNAHQLLIGDLDRDGRGDLVMLAFSALSVALGNGDGTFGAPTDPVSGITFTTGVLVDLNRDGTLDLALAHPAATAVSILLGNGAGGFSPRMDIALGQATNVLVAGDLNGDHTVDLVCAGASGVLSTLLGRGDGTFTLVTGVQETPASAAAIGDLNADGASDLTLIAGGELRVLLGAGDGTFGAAERFGSGGVRPTWIGIDDWNRDGRPDVAVTNAGWLEHSYPEHCDYRDGSIVLLPNTGAIATPVALALVSTEVDANRVRLTWSGGTIGSPRAAVHRTTEAEGTWTEIGNPSIESGDRLVFEDRTVLPGTRYGYELIVWDRGEVMRLAPIWVTIPGRTGLSLIGASPNPAGRELMVEFSLPGDQAATLELHDLRGRRIARREVGSLGAGAHRVVLGDARDLAAGIYLLSLSQGQRVLTRKACIVK